MFLGQKSVVKSYGVSGLVRRKINVDGGVEILVDRGSVLGKALIQRYCKK